MKYARMERIAMTVNPTEATVLTELNMPVCFSGVCVGGRVELSTANIAPHFWQKAEPSGDLFPHLLQNIEIPPCSQSITLIYRNKNKTRFGIQMVNQNFHGIPQNVATKNWHRSIAFFLSLISSQ